jgi:hypothetical protein
MKRARLMMIMEILVMLLVLQFSCTAPKREQVYKGPPVSSSQAQTAAIVTEASLLGDKHQANGMSCSGCHKETPPSSDVPTSICLDCHEDYQKITASDINPHNSHMTYTHCTDCHHAHRPSKNQCLNCHSFNLQAP